MPAVAKSGIYASYPVYMLAGEKVTKPEFCTCAACFCSSNYIAAGARLLSPFLRAFQIDSCFSYAFLSF